MQGVEAETVLSISEDETTMGDVTAELGVTVKGTCFIGWGTTREGECTWDEDKAGRGASIRKVVCAGK